MIKFHKLKRFSSLKNTNSSIKKSEISAVDHFVNCAQEYLNFAEDYELMESTETEEYIAKKNIIAKFTSILIHFE
jgi:hypothetical protein